MEPVTHDYRRELVIIVLRYRTIYRKRAKGAGATIYQRPNTYQSDGTGFAGHSRVLKRIVAVIPTSAILRQVEVVCKLVARSNRALRYSIHAVHVPGVQLAKPMPVD